LDQADVSAAERAACSAPPDAELAALLEAGRARVAAGAPPLPPPAPTRAAMPAAARSGPVRPSHTTVVGLGVSANGASAGGGGGGGARPPPAAARVYDEKAPGRAPADAGDATLRANGVLQAALALLREVDADALERIIAAAKDRLAALRRA